MHRLEPLGYCCAQHCHLHRQLLRKWKSNKTTLCLAHTLELAD